MARITHPRPQAGKQTFIGVTFHDGFAEVDLRGKDILAQALVQHGYTILHSLDDVATEFGVDLAERPAQTAKRSGKGKAANSEKAAEQVTAHADGSFTVPDGYSGALPDADPSLYGPDSTPLDAAPAPAPFMDLTLEELRTVARFEGIEIEDDADENDIIAAFAVAGMATD